MLDLEPIEERLFALNSRPWALRSMYIECTDNQGDDRVLMRFMDEYGDQRDLTFIAHAPEDIEALVAEVKLLRAILTHAIDDINSHELADGPIGCRVWLSNDVLKDIGACISLKPT